MLGSMSTSLVEMGLIGPGLATMLGSFGGPIGAGVGALVGVLMSLGPKHQQDRHTFEMAELDTIHTLLTQYQLGGVSYNQTLTALEQLKTQGEQQFTTWGAANHIADQVDSHINIAESQLQQQESDKQAKAAATAAEQARRAGVMFGAAQFGGGGVVDSSARRPWLWADAPRFDMGGAVPAILHEGEGVINRSGMQRVGVQGLNRINSGAGGGDTHYNISLIDARGFEDYLKRSGWESIQRVARLMRSEGR
jgi:hypothetical protein